MMRPAPSLLLALALGGAILPAARADTVGAFVSDNHGRHFFYLARVLDPAVSYHLLLFDAHSDTAPVSDYPAVRRLLHGRHDDRAGLVQCYNWIHGLTPGPITGLTWVPAFSDAPAAYRIAAPFRRTVADWFPDDAATVVPFHRLATALPKETPFVVSVDLDFFTSSPRPERDIAAVFRYIKTLPRVAYITIAISRPFLPDDVFAYATLHAALSALLERRDIPVIEFDLTPEETGADLSRRAVRITASGFPVPRFDPTRSPGYLKELVAAHREKFLLRGPTAAWDPFRRPDR